MSDTTELPQVARLAAIVARLRSPEGGCPWDLEQSQESMAPHLLEEAYEAVDAILAGRPERVCEELGDVLMNVMMVAQISKDGGGFDLERVARGIADKLVRRHPHVFGDVEARDPDQVLRNWEAIKRREGDREGGRRGVLSGVPASLPALLRSLRMGEKAARAGFDWPDAEGPRRKVDEELAELDGAIDGRDPRLIEAEIGDVLFSLVNLARHCGVDPEMALRRTADRFAARFAYVEERLGERFEAASLEEKEALWQDAKGKLP